MWTNILQVWMGEIRVKSMSSHSIDRVIVRSALNVMSPGLAWNRIGHNIDC